MNTRRAACTALLALAVLTGCSSTGADDKPTPTVTVTKTPKLSAAAKRDACVNAWADVIGSRPADWDQDTDTDVEPAECKGLPEGDYTDMYMEGLYKSNDKAIDDAQREIDEASAAAQP